MTTTATRFSAPPQGGLGSCIEQFDAHTSIFDAGDCPNPKVPWLMGLNHDKRQAVLFRPRCKLWSCPVCGKMNAWVWAFRANDGAHTLYDLGHNLDFVCITSHEKLSPKASWWVAPHAWMKLQARVRREVGAWHYFSVPEVQGNGRVHFHMITTAKLSQRWWKNNARSCGWGYQNDAREVHYLGGVIGYMTKYLTKALDVTGMPPRTRHVRTSRGWPKSPDREPPEGWTFQKLPRGGSIERLEQGLKGVGYHVELKGSKGAWRFIDDLSEAD